MIQQRPPTAKGFVFFTMEEEDGLMNVFVRPHAYQRCYKVLRNCFPLMVDGTILGPTIPASAAVGDARFRGPPSQILAHARSRQRGTGIWQAQRT